MNFCKNKDCFEERQEHLDICSTCYQKSCKEFMGELGEK